MIRDAGDADGSALIALIGACWAEYPGCILDVDREVPELRAIATHFANRGGRFWVVEDADRIVGCIGVAPTPVVGIWELLKLYVAPAARRQGLGRRLTRLVEETVRGAGGRSVLLWSDTRFADAHRLYRRMGYVLCPDTRALNDLSNTVEYRFLKDLDGANPP